MATSDHNFSRALSTWKEIDLSDLQKTLDAQGLELVENQKESLVGRKALADRTKEFRKLTDADKLVEFKGLLKAYQTEIDNLTKRSKAAENAFLNAYKILAEAPDPYPLLEAAVDQTVKIAETQSLEAELHSLRDENVDLKRRNGDLLSAEAAKKKADQKVEQLEEKMEDLIKESVHQKENELNATYDEKMRNYEDRERDLQRQVELAKTQLRELRTSNESTQAKLLDHNQRQDHEVVSKLAELDMVVADLERANTRVAAVERRNELLRAEIEAVKSGSDHTDRTKALEAQVADLEAEIDKLSHAVENQKTMTIELETSSAKLIDEAQREGQAKTSEVEALKQKLKQLKDYDEIKRELEIMKFVEFGGFEDEDISHETNETNYASPMSASLQLPNPNAVKANARVGKSLESLLATKNKRLQEELTKIRLLHGELEASLRSAQHDLESVDSELQRQRTLNEQLELDLLQMDARNINGSANELAESMEKGGLEGLELGPKRGGSPSRTNPIPFASSADTSILPIVTSQRDRFRQRNAELEEELRKQFSIISELRTEVKSLQSDNIKLYEKVRYMQSYRDEVAAGPSTSTLNPILRNRAEGAGRTDDLSKYRTRYEDAMNPFEAFRGREVIRAVQALNPIERSVLALTRAILGNRRARSAFVFYALALHLLVIFTTYQSTVASDTQLQRQPSPHG